jgi:hypothetical protein
MTARRVGESAMVFLSGFRVGDRAGAIPEILMSPLIHERCES